MDDFPSKPFNPRLPRPRVLLLEEKYKLEYGIQRVKEALAIHTFNDFPNVSFIESEIDPSEEVTEKVEFSEEVTEKVDLSEDPTEEFDAPEIFDRENGWSRNPFIRRKNIHWTVVG